MNVTELYRLTIWVNEELVQPKLPQKYSQLHSVLQQNAQPNQPKAAFETQQNELINAIKEIDLSWLTRDQVSFLDELGILQSLGDHGVQQIENILFRNALDITTAAQKIQDIHNKLNEGLKKIKLIADGLEGCVYEDEEELSEEVLIRVSFFGDASISNVKDFKDWGAKWHDIGRGIAMAHGSAPENIRITGAAKGSVILELMTDPALATTVSAVIWGALKVTEKVQDIRKKAAEVQNLKLQNKKITKELQDAAEQEKEAGIATIIEEQTNLLKLDNGSSGDKHKALEKAIKTLVDFIDLGGEVDFVVPDDERNEEDSADDVYEKLREQAQEIRLLEDKLKLLDHQNSEGE
jgi:hypothetical protein